MAKWSFMHELGLTEGTTPPPVRRLLRYRWRVETKAWEVGSIAEHS